MLLITKIINKMIHSVKTSWQGNMQFDAVVNGHTIKMDAMPESGGNDIGPRPKELMLSALAGCTAMDVISILKKMRVEPDKFNVNVEAEITEEHPKHYEKMKLVYEFHGKNLPMDKLEKAVELSQERYCGVSFMYRKMMELSHEIKVVES